MSGLKSDDFQLLEDGRPQQMRTFAFEEIRDAHRASRSRRGRGALRRVAATARRRPRRGAGSR